MAKFTNTQLIVLSGAAQRDEGAATVPARMNRAAAVKVGASLVGRKLMREVLTKPGMPEWRKNGDGRPVSLVILKAGREAVGVEEGRAEPVVTKDLESGQQPGAGPAQKGSKQAFVVELLSRKDGATIDDLIAATGWLPHTTRAALTGLRKRGHTIERQRADKITRYKIVVARETSAIPFDKAEGADRLVAEPA